MGLTTCEHREEYLSVDNETTAVRSASGDVYTPELFSNEAARGYSIRLEAVHLGEALGVDPEGKKDHGVAAEVEGTKQAAAAADILERLSNP